MYFDACDRACVCASYIKKVPTSRKIVTLHKESMFDCNPGSCHQSEAAPIS